MMRTVEDIRRELRHGPHTDATTAAIRLLADSSLVALSHGSGSNTVANFLRTYKGRLDLVPVTGLRQQGLAEFVSELAALPPAALLTVSAFETVDRLAAFWPDASGKLVGVVLVERQDDTARREWFNANLA